MMAARKDQNPAVRMKALESLRDAAADDAFGKCFSNPWNKT